MTLALQICTALLAGFLLGCLQSFLVGVLIGSWDGGTGCAWGVIVAVPSALSAVWLGWHSLTLAAAVSAVILGWSLLWILYDVYVHWRRRRRR